MPDVVPIHKTQSILGEIADMQDRIMRRAYEIFEQTGGMFGRDLDNWIQAERELLWQPAIEVVEKDNEFTIRAAISGLDTKDIEIEATQEDIVLKADIPHKHDEKKGTVHICEFDTGKMFRSIHLPKKIDPDSVKAEFRNGLLRVTAEIAEEARVKKVKPEAA